MKLARELRYASWRQMLAGMSSSELSEWARFYHEQYFECDLLDGHFSSLSHLVVSIMYDTELTPRHFSLLNPVPDEDMDDDVMMSIAENIPGGVRYVPDGGGGSRSQP